MAVLELDGGRLSADSVEQLRVHSDLLPCQCPQKLLEILDTIRGFTDYTSDCIVKYPADAETHQWLRTAALNLDKLLCGTVMQLARMEGFINEANEIVSRDKT
jgi:glutaredoxin 2